MQAADLLSNQLVPDMRPRSAAILINLHRERLLARRTLAFAERAQSFSRRRGLQLNPIIILDSPDDLTLEIARHYATHMDAEIDVVSYRNLGDSRTHGLGLVRDEITFFLDGDDLTSLNWFEAAAAHLDQPGNERHICHTEYFAMFGADRAIRVGIDSRDPGFDPAELALDWFFCNNLACRTEVFSLTDVKPYDHSRGIGGEDWLWSSDALASGFQHVVIPGTVYFYRIKPTHLSLGRAGNYLPNTSLAWTRSGPPRADTGAILANEGVRTRQAWKDLLSQAETQADVRAECADAARQIADLEPQVSWLYDDDPKWQPVVPAVNPDALAAVQRVANAGPPARFVVVSPEEHAGSFEDLKDLIARVVTEGGPTVILECGAPAPSLFADMPGVTAVRATPASTLKLNGAETLSWSRFCARMSIDYGPELHAVLSPTVASLLLPYSLQHESFARRIVGYDFSLRADALQPVKLNEWCACFPRSDVCFPGRADAIVKGGVGPSFAPHLDAVLIRPGRIFATISSAHDMVRVVAASLAELVERVAGARDEAAVLVSAFPHQPSARIAAEMAEIISRAADDDAVAQVLPACAFFDGRQCVLRHIASPDDNKLDALLAAQSVILRARDLIQLANFSPSTGHAPEPFVDCLVRMKLMADKGKLKVRVSQSEGIVGIAAPDETIAAGRIAAFSTQLQVANE